VHFSQNVRVLKYISCWCVEREKIYLSTAKGLLVLELVSVVSQGQRIQFGLVLSIEVCPSATLRAVDTLAHHRAIPKHMCGQYSLITKDLN
jgi:hypothetical protein